MRKNDSDKRLIRFAVVTILLLLVSLVYVGIKSSNTQSTLKETQKEMEAILSINAELEEDYNLAIQELESLKGDNAELNNRIDAQIIELGRLKTQINGLLKNKRDLDAAKAQIAEMKASVAEYLEEINRLVEEKNQLEDKASTLQVDLGKESAKRKELEEKTGELSNLNQKLTSQNEDLSNKVTQAASIKIAEIAVSGIEVKRSGKEKSSRKASKADKLEVCFSALDNLLSEQGKEKFYIRIIAPSGETISSKNFGGGTMVEKEKGKEVRYTFASLINYKKEGIRACVEYATDEPFAKGKYAVEFYNKGYLSGKSEFELK
jgi:predicted nuclease with TOPRIM domain